MTGERPSFVELYGKGRIVEASHSSRRNLNLNGLAALDLRTAKPDGTHWDFNRAEDRQLARDIVARDKPTWVIGSPPCRACSILNNNLNFQKMKPEDVRQMQEEGVRHLHFVLSLYKMQLDGHRHLLHEHPETATSWRDPWAVNILKHPRVLNVRSDQCEYGLYTRDSSGQLRLAKKPTRWATSSPQMAARLSKRCSRTHTHEPLLAGKAKAAEDCSDQLILEILRGMRDTEDALHADENEAACGDIPGHRSQNVGLLHDMTPGVTFTLSQQERSPPENSAHHPAQTSRRSL